MSTSASVSTAKVLGTNAVLANAVNSKEQAFRASGGDPSSWHLPNLHQAPPLTDTHGVVTPLYYVAPAPMGVAYYGLSNTTGTIQGTTLNTTSLQGTWNTTDPLGTAAELFDTSSGNAAGTFGAQLNTVLVNVTLDGQTAFGPNTNAPTGCSGFYTGLQSNYCPNEFWLQNYIEYTESTHTLTISEEIWNFSNPTADFVTGPSTPTITGFGSVEESEVYQSPTVRTFTIPAPYTFSLALYFNYTQGPCHTDSVAGSGVPSCPAGFSTVYPLNELFLNYSVRSATGARLCPSTIATGKVCGESDDVFFASALFSGATSGVPAFGPNGRIGSATIQANGTAYDPVGLTNDFEMDYGIGSDDGATNFIEYQNGTVGVNVCPNSNAVENPYGATTCTSYAATPAAVDFGGETGETSTGEVAYWAPQGASFATSPGPTLLTGAATPVAHLVTGPSLLVGLWNMTGSKYTGHTPYPAYTGAEPLSYKNIHPANAWVGIAQDQSPGVEVTSQSLFQVAPTFGFFSYWKGSGGAPSPTTLGANLFLPTGWYTIEVLLSGYLPSIQQIDLTGPHAPSINLFPDFSTGAYTPDWAFSNSDLANLSVSSSNTVPSGAGTALSPYVISAGAPNVGTVDSDVLGEPGSVSWLFSNLNDYLFTQWIGAFVNSTTAVSQFNPAPSFPMEYPSWQLSALAQFDVPSTDGFQYYLLNTQNVAVIGASDIYAWGNSEATTIYSFIVNNGVNDLIAGNTFQISNRGLDFTGGGTTSTFTVNGVVVPPTLAPARNFVWGNTFVPHPQTSYTGLEPFTAQDSLTLGESLDRVYNNAFDAYSATVNATANAGATDTAFWNATCVGGYNPLGPPNYYPGPTACEPTSYSQTLDGFTMTGSIIGSNYQGGNFWAVYGNEPNPYANIPVKARLTAVTGTAEIGSTTYPFAGDYAPLIAITVYDPTFTETGLPSSSSATTFSVQIFASSGSPLLWLNSSATSATPAGCAASTICVRFYVPSGTYQFHVSNATISSTVYDPSPAVGTFVVSGAPLSPIAILFVVGYTVTFTETGLVAATRWYINITGQAPLTSTTTKIFTSLASAAYTFTAASVNKLYVESYTPSFTVSGAPLGVGVTFDLALTGPPAPSVSATALDVDQALTVTDTIPTTGNMPYAWTWLISVNGGAYGAASQCSTNSGTGASGGATETCSIAANTLTVADTYAFELQVTDNAQPPETQTSSASSTVTVASALTAPAAPSVSLTSMDSDQPLMVTGTVPSTGTAPLTWTWLVSVNGGSDVAATQCTVDSGTGSGPVTCTIPGGTLTAGDTYTFELTVTDSATAPETQTSSASSTVTVASGLTAPATPSVSATALDVDQALTVTDAIPTTGTAPYAWTWLISVNGGAYGSASQCSTNSGSGASGGATETCSIAANTLTVADTYAFELTVTDSANTPQTTTSSASSTVTVASALTAPAAPSVSSTVIDADQPLTVTGTIPTTGTSTYSWTWLVSVNGGSDIAATQCTANTGTGALAGATVACSVPGGTLTGGDTYTFELQVADSATAPESETSPASSAVMVSSALTAPAAPSVSATKLDVNQALTVMDAIPTTGTAPYAWTWLVSVNGGAYGTATECAVNAGTGALAGATVTCSIAASKLTVGDTYAFELKVTDSAPSPQTKTSSASSTVTVKSALTAPGAPTVNLPALDANQVLKVTGKIPTTGTGPYAWTWLISANSGPFLTATQCAVASGTGAAAGATETCSIAANALTAGSYYTFELQVSDSATAPETQTSAYSLETVTVSSALTAPAAPSVSATALDVNQALTVTGSIPTTGTGPYAWTWLVSVNGGAYGTATKCAVDSGTGALAGATETCSIAASALKAGDHYSFELKVKDSATTPETQTSSPSSTVPVSSALKAPSKPTVSSTRLVVSQTLTVTGKLPTSGSSPYGWEWLVSVNGGAYVLATQCAVDIGSGGAAGATVTCTISGGTLTVGDTYSFELQVTDGATVPQTQTSAASKTVTVVS